MTSLATLHEQALSKYASVKSRLDSHKAVIATGVMRLVASAEAAAGGAGAAALDYYIGGGSSPAMVGPVPVVAATALAGTALAIMAGREEWATHVANFASGMGAASAYVETLAFLNGMSAASPASNGTSTI